MTGLRRHIPEIAIDWAIDTPERLWRAVDGTLCFEDISGFTALAERLALRGRLGGEELVEALSRVFGAMLDSAEERDRMLLKFGGDALLFLFRGEGHAVRAARMAVEMRRALRKVAEIPTSVGRLRLSMSVGLHSGTLHFFLVDPAHRAVGVHELGTLARAVERTSAGEGGLTTIVGAMGLGKTRLLREATSDLDPALLISLRAELYGASSAYRIFRDPIRSLLGVERASMAAMRKALEQGAARADAGLLPWLALLGDVAHVDVEPSPEVSAVAPRIRPDRLADTVIQLLAATHPGPLILLFDDAQWADEASAHLLGRIARECDERPWLLLVARRDGEEGVCPRNCPLRQSVRSS
jgi:hypothetical protein